MKYIIKLAVGDTIKPIEEATPEERKALDEKIKASFLKHLGLRYIGDDTKQLAKCEGQ